MASVDDGFKLEVREDVIHSPIMTERRARCETGQKKTPALLMK